MQTKETPKTTAGIKTTGQLRGFLADLLVGIKNGHVAVDRASSITKMAAQINESFYSEIKIARFNNDLKKDTAALGDLALGDFRQV